MGLCGFQLFQKVNQQALGFDRVGVLRDVGRKFDAWQDVCLMQRALVDKPSGRG